MGAKINVAYSKKLGLPNYGSEGAHCELEIEMDSSVFGNPQDFQNRVREIYRKCRDAVENELRGETSPEARPATSSPVSRGASASPKQAKYAEQLASQVKVRNLDNLCDRMYQKPFAALTGLETSNLIDTLREVKAGRLDLAAI